MTTGPPRQQHRPRETSSTTTSAWCPRKTSLARRPIQPSAEAGGGGAHGARPGQRAVVPAVCDRKAVWTAEAGHQAALRRRPDGDYRVGERAAAASAEPSCRRRRSSGAQASESRTIPRPWSVGLGAAGRGQGVGKPGQGVQAAERGAPTLGVAGATKESARAPPLGALDEARLGARPPQGALCHHRHEPLEVLLPHP